MEYFLQKTDPPLGYLRRKGAGIQKCYKILLSDPLIKLGITTDKTY